MQMNMDKILARDSKLLDNISKQRHVKSILSNPDNQSLNQQLTSEPTPRVHHSVHYKPDMIKYSVPTEHLIT